MQNRRYEVLTGILSGFVLLCCVSIVQARHSARVVLNNGQTAQGIVRYLPASRSYEINANGVTREVRADDVQQIILAQQPAQLNEAIANVQRGQYQQAVPILKKIAEDYIMFGPDVEAGKALMTAYLRMNRSGEALKAAEDLVRRNPQLPRQAGFASVYWEVLLAEGRTASLQTAIQEAIQTGSRELAAVGLLRRGDIEMKGGRAREALVDGYLRVVLLFRDIGSVQAEALFKAIKAHEALNEVTYAERWRQRLLTNFATSEYAGRLR